MELPIVCTLTEAELAERRRRVLDVLAGMQIGVKSMADGYRYLFEPTSEVLAQLIHLVELERQCCKFLTFRIIVEPGNVPIQMEISGPPQAVPVIAELFGGRSSDNDL